MAVAADGKFGQRLKFCTISRYLDMKYRCILTCSLGYNITINFLLIVICIKAVKNVLRFIRRHSHISNYGIYHRRAAAITGCQSTVINMHTRITLTLRAST